METATHTPGPWAFSESELTPGKFSIYHNGPLAYCGDTGDGIENARANARLIAAAPELLATLQRLLAAESRMGGNNPLAGLCDEARDVVARATGAA